MDSRITQRPAHLTGMPPVEKKDDLISGIMDGLKEAQRAHIRANAVMINSRFVKMPASAVPYCIKVNDMLMPQLVRLPAMMLGLKMFFTDELPDEYAFAVCEGALQDDYDRLKAENRRLRETLAAIQNVLGVDADG